MLVLFSPEKGFLFLDVAQSRTKEIHYYAQSDVNGWKVRISPDALRISLRPGCEVHCHAQAPMLRPMITLSKPSNHSELDGYVPRRNPFTVAINFFTLRSKGELLDSCGTHGSHLKNFSVFQVLLSDVATKKK